MKTEIDVPSYDPVRGLQIRWEPGFTILTQVENGTVLIQANRAGLVSLARHLLMLAQAQVPSGHHVHYDDMNSLEEGSCQMIIMKL
jgi:hypothetical protein